VLHIGDHDPSGLSILDAAAEDVQAFVDQLGGQPPTFTRLAVTAAQITQFNLPTAPQKTTDRRGAHMPATVQTEALPPDQLTAILTTALRGLVDTTALRRVRRQSGVPVANGGNPTDMAMTWVNAVRSVGRSAGVATVPAQASSNIVGFLAIATGTPSGPFGLVRSYSKTRSRTGDYRVGGAAARAAFSAPAARSS
jgi:hypothetical protein